MRVWKRRLRSLRQVSALLFLLAMLATGQRVFGQGATGAINGSVRDPSGAAIPQASVVLQNVATGMRRVALTDNTGEYVFPDVIPGRYTIQINKAGFKTVSEPPFQLNVNETSTHNFTMTLGSTRQTVTVTAAAIHIEATTAELGTAIQQTEVNNLPLNGRNFTQLLELTPGVSPISTGQNSGGGGGFTGNAIGTFTFPAVNGQGNRSNMFLVDGFTNYGFTGNYAVAPVVDQIAEFKVQSHNDSAAYGGSLGGIVNVVTRGGTSQYHGDVWEFFRNNALDARNTFLPTTTPYKQNQFGGVFGGPLKLHRNSQPKTFFFAAYEGFRSSRAAESLDNLITPAEFAGNLSSVSELVYNPFTTQPDPNLPGQFTRQPIAGNQIPSALIDQPLVSYTQAMYKGTTYENTGIPGVNFIETVPNLTRQDTASLRFDHEFSVNTSGWVRYTGFTQPSTSGTGLPTSVYANYIHGYQAGGAITHSFGGGTKVATFRFGRTSAQANVTTKLASGVSPNVWEGVFAPIYNIESPFLMVPGTGVPGYQGVPGGSFQGNHYADVYEWAGDFTWVHGHHTIQTGADFNTNNGAQPIYFVNQCYSAINTANLLSPTGTGSPLASYLLGVPITSNQRKEFIGSPGGWVDGAYVQDQWRVSRRLELNLGLRWDVTLWPIQNGPPGSQNEYTGDTDLDTGQYILAGRSTPPPACSATVTEPCIPNGGVLPAHVILNQLGNGGIIHNRYDNFQPRVGVAYRLGKATVLRASGGKIYDNWAAIQQLGTNWQGNWPSIGFVLASNLNAPTLANPTPTALASDPLNLGAGVYPSPTPFNQVNWMIDPYFQDAYSMQWNFGIQHQFGNNTILEADYVGSADTHTDSGAYRNVDRIPGDPASMPYPYITPTYFDKSIGHATYNSFQFSFRRNVTQGLTYLVSYTYSKAENLGCDGYFGSEGCSIQNPYNLGADWSVAGYDVTHLLSASWVYNLPFGKGQRFRTSSRLANALIGNWQLNGILSARSGVPYNVNASGPDIENTGNVFERANQIGPAFVTNPNATQFLNPASFVDPAPNTYGTEGRNNLRSPPVSDMDLSLFRQFPLTEDKRLQFRVDFFNAGNWQALSPPDSTIGDPHFGAVFSTAQTERQIQFALKLYF
jgi:hypothetical protein